MWFFVHRHVDQDLEGTGRVKMEDFFAQLATLLTGAQQVRIYMPVDLSECPELGQLACFVILIKPLHQLLGVLNRIGLMLIWAVIALLMSIQVCISSDLIRHAS